MTLFDFEGKCYYIDLNKLISWVSDTPTKQRNVETSITQIYPMEIVDEMENAGPSKEITETKNSLNETLNTFKYDLVRNLINVILSPLINSEDGSYLPFDPNNLFLGQTIAFNTLLNEGIIIEVKQD